MALDVKGEEKAATDVYAKLHKHGDNGDFLASFSTLVYRIGRNKTILTGTLQMTLFLSKEMMAMETNMKKYIDVYT
ncbi:MULTISPECIES: hypothetical protein [Heyndrickxia]|uniref:Uncharacterized protein n=1 Tax=Heyndrickxia coagulans TaxID=1398 RepID=A0A133KBP1_HEYCO|nr:MULTISPECIES: hypothetical protein [Heyndrickxia]KWZ76950.1 hypothetical protein HMPREF3213_03552 [Heyndrickxia coagulans]MEC2224561.1 hypothetical protein [Weizmannia sp. CD-2023]